MRKIGYSKKEKKGGREKSVLLSLEAEFASTLLFPG